MFITFEGPDGSGKTTQSKLAAEFLKKIGRNVLWTREPGGCDLGEKLRNILLEDMQLKLDKNTELFLFCADRAQHVAEIIRPALAQGRIVICDRYTDSTTAYQAGGRGFDPKMIQTLNEYSTGGLRPDLTVLIDVPVDIGLKRAGLKNISDKFEAETGNFHEKVRSKYLELAKQDPKRVKVFDGTLDMNDNTRSIQQLLTDLIK